MSTHQWNGRGVVAAARCRPRRCTATSPSSRVQARERVAQRARRQRAISSSVAAVEARRRRTAARRARVNGVVDAGGHHADGVAVATMQSRRVPRRSRRHEVALRAAKRSSTCRRAAARTSSAIELRVRMLDRRARRPAVVHERLRVREPVRRGGSAARSRSATNTSVAASTSRARRAAVVRGREHDDLVRAGDAVADDRVQVRHDAHLPARRVGRARRRRARPRAASRLVPAQNGHVGDASPARGAPSARNVSGRGRAAGRDDHARRRSARRSRSSCIGWSG